MPHDVRQALLHDPIDCQTLHVTGHRLDHADELDVHRVLAPIVRNQLLKCRLDPQLIQCRRAQLHREIPQPRERIRRLVTDREQRLLQQEKKPAPQRDRHVAYTHHVIMRLSSIW